MSGEKIAQARLAERAKREIEEEITRVRKTETARAGIAGTAARAQSFLESLSAESDLAPGFREAVDGFAHRATGLAKGLESLNQTVADAGAAHTPDEARRHRREAEALAGKLDSLARKVQSEFASMTSGLNAERRSREHRAREGLAELRAELASRARLGAGCPLDTEKAQALAARLAALSVPTQEELAECRRELADMITKAERHQAEEAERARILKLVRRTMEEAGFELRAPTRLDPTDDSVTAVFVKPSAGARAAMRLCRGGAIHLSMSDRTGDTSTGDRHEIWSILQHLPEDLTFDSVKWKGPVRVIELELPTPIRRHRRAPEREAEL